MFDGFGIIRGPGVVLALRFWPQNGELRMPIMRIYDFLNMTVFSRETFFEYHHLLTNPKESKSRQGLDTAFVEACWVLLNLSSHLLFVRRLGQKIMLNKWQARPCNATISAPSEDKNPEVQWIFNGE